MSLLEQTAGKLGHGEVVTLTSGERIFKLDSYEGNPVVIPQQIGLTWNSNRHLRTGAVFNPGAALYRSQVILTPRCHKEYTEGTFIDPQTGIQRRCLENYVSEVWMLSSEDGITFDRFQDALIQGDGTDHSDFTYGIEDVRIVRHQERYILSGCAKVGPAFKAHNADRVAIYSTRDFVNITYHGIITAFHSRNCFPFHDPQRDRWYMVLRFYPQIHVVALEAGLEPLLHPSEYEAFWNKIYRERDKSLLMTAGDSPHEREKIGASLPPLKTDRGWLFLYHAVGTVGAELCRQYGLKEEIERGYTVCAALLDPEDPAKLICRTRKPVYIPSKPYELYGSPDHPVDVPAVIFPVGGITVGDTLMIYCGAADKYVVLISCSVKGLVDYLLKDCLI